MKYLISIILATLTFNVVAEQKIVYVDVEQVYLKSAVVNKQFKLIQQNHLKQQQLYIQQQHDLELKINTRIQSNKQADINHLALQEKELQESIEKLNKTYEQQMNNLKNSYILAVRKAALQLQQQNHYQYVLSSNLIIATDKENDISPQVTKLADTLYTAKPQKKRD